MSRFQSDQRIYMRFNPVFDFMKDKNEDFSAIGDKIALLPESQERLLESYDMEDDVWPELDRMLESVSLKYSKFKANMGVIKTFRKQLDQALTGLTITDVTSSKPRKNGMFVFTTTQFKISDGQTITAYFHAPEAEKVSLAPQDLLISYRFTVNKLDVTGAVVKMTGRDLPASKIARILASIVSDNKENFAAKKAAKEEKLATLETLKTDYESAVAESETLMGDLTVMEGQDQAMTQEVESLESEITSKEFQLKDLQNQIQGLSQNPKSDETGIDAETQKVAGKKTSERTIVIRDFSIEKVLGLDEDTYAEHFNRLVMDNEHTESLVLKAKRTGIADLVDRIKALAKKHEEAGFISAELRKEIDVVEESINAALSAKKIQPKDQGEADPVIDDKGEVTLDALFISDGWTKDTKSKLGGVIKEVNGDKYKVYDDQKGNQVIVKNRKKLESVARMNGLDNEAFKTHVDNVIRREEDLKAAKKDHADQVKKATAKGIEIIGESMAKLGWQPNPAYASFKKSFGDDDVLVSFKTGMITTDLEANKVGEVGIEYDSAVRMNKKEMAWEPDSMTLFSLSAREDDAYYSVTEGNMPKADKLAKTIDDKVKEVLGVSDKPANEPIVDEGDKTPEPVPQPAVADGSTVSKTTANDILGGKYDDNPAELEAHLESIIDDLGATDPDLLEKVSNYYSDILVEMA